MQTDDDEITTIKLIKYPPLVKLVRKLSNNYSAVISRADLAKYVGLTWGGNGIGDRWANKMFNYSVVYSGNKAPKTYSDEIDDLIPVGVLSDFSKGHKSGSGIIGIFVHSTKDSKTTSRPISKEIRQKILKKRCVTCDNGAVIPDHKNDLYNDPRVLSTGTQKYSDFQPLCNQCNLRKRQVNKVEKENSKLYSAKQITIYRSFSFEFPWEKKAFDHSDVDCKKDTYWYDPVEFTKKIDMYSTYRVPINEMVKKNIPLIKC